MKSGFKGFVKQLWQHYLNANITDSSAVLSYYMLLAFFPILLIAGNLVTLLHFDADSVLSYVAPILPDAVFQTFSPVIRSFLEQGSTGTLSLGILVTIWSAGRAVAAFQRSINQAYGIQTPNAIFSRFFSFLLILLIIILIALIALLFGLSEWLGTVVQPWLKISNQVTDFIGTVRWPVSFIGILLLSALLYAVVPSAKIKIRYVWIGAFVTTVGWLVLAQGFSLYVRYFAQNVTGYQTIGAFIVTIVWVNISSMILLLGGVVNATVQEWRQGEIEEVDFMQNLVDQARSSRKKQQKKKSASHHEKGSRH